jgi:hypothetical protein
MTVPDTAPDLDALIERLRDPTYDGDALHRIAAATALVQLREENAAMREALEMTGNSALHWTDEAATFLDRAERAEAEVARLAAWESRAVASMNEASTAAGVLCCDLIPARIAALEAEVARLNGELARTQ